MTRQLLARYVVLAVLCARAQPAPAHETPTLLCRDVRSIAPRDLLLMGVLRDVDSLVFEGERICSSDGYELGTINCGFEYSIKDLTVLKPSADTEVRLVSTVKNHLTGSGAFETIRGFQCKDGGMATVFSKEFYYGASFEQISDTEFALTGGSWSGDAPSCCPSYKKRIVYSWDLRAGEYRSAGETCLKRNPKTNTDEAIGKPANGAPCAP